MFPIPPMSACDMRAKSPAIATRPKTRPVFNLTMPLNAVPHLMEYLQDVLDRQAELDAKNAG